MFLKSGKVDKRPINFESGHLIADDFLRSWNHFFYGFPNFSRIGRISGTADAMYSSMLVKLGRSFIEKFPEI